MLRKDQERKVTRKQLEVDFVCNLGSSRYYIQSVYSLPDEAKALCRKLDHSEKLTILSRRSLLQKISCSRIMMIMGF